MDSEILVETTVHLQENFLRSAGVVVLAVAIGACVSSDETGKERASHEPQQSVAPVDTVRMKAIADSLAAAHAAQFTTRQDTLEASVTRRTRSPRTIRPVQRPDNPAYTVQIGAFAVPQNALNFQKLARERFAELPVFNTYEPFDGLYRVSVGKYDTWLEAAALKREMLRQYAADYADCWINYIPK